MYADLKWCWVGLALVGCSVSSPTISAVTGTVKLPEATRGDVYVFLLSEVSGDVFAGPRPIATTAISDVRLSAGERTFLFPRLADGQYRVAALLDADRNLRPEIDVLAQSSAADRLSLPSAPISVVDGQSEPLELEFGPAVGKEPPAFSVSDGGVVEFPDTLALSTLTLTKALVDGVDAARSGFEVRLVDDNGDGQPDDADGDGIVDLYPRILLRHLPKPGQTVAGSDGGVLSVALPLLINPFPFLSSLNGSLTQTVVVDSLQTTVIPQALGLEALADGGTMQRTLAGIPLGDYQLWVIEKRGVFWHVPNDLGQVQANQSTRFRVVRAALDGGN